MWVWNVEFWVRANVHHIYDRRSSFFSFFPPEIMAINYNMVWRVLESPKGGEATKTAKRNSEWNHGVRFAKKLVTSNICFFYTESFASLPFEAEWNSIASVIAQHRRIFALLDGFHLERWNPNIWIYIRHFRCFLCLSIATSVKV